MKTVKVIALKQHVYKRKPRTRNDVYEMDVVDYAAYAQSGRVTVAESEKRRYNRRDMRPKE